MSEIYMNPEKFQSQIDSYESGTEQIGALSYTMSDVSGALRALDQYAQCLTAYNETVKLLRQMLENDTLSMKSIKATWMNTDSSLATKTLGENVSGFFSGLFSE